MTNNYNPDQKRGGAANAGNWTKYENSDPESPLGDGDLEAERLISFRKVRGERGGFDTITVIGFGADFADQVTRRFDSGRLHNTVGAAVEYSDGSAEFWVDGVQLTPPEADCRLTGTTPSGIREWAAGENRAVDVHPNGTQLWTRDGDLHRDGAPAIVGPGGVSGAWYRGGTEIPNPVPAQPAVEDTDPESATRGFVTSTGSRYIAGRTMQSIAADISKDLDNAVRAQYISDRHGAVTFFVKATDSYRNGRKLSIAVNGISHSDMFGPNDQTFMVPEVAELRQKLQAIGDAQNKIMQEKSGDANAQDFVADVTFNTRSTR